MVRRGGAMRGGGLPRERVRLRATTLFINANIDLQMSDKSAAAPGRLFKNG